MQRKKTLYQLSELLIGLAVLGGAVGIYLYVAGSRGNLARQRQSSPPAVKIATLSPTSLAVEVEALGTGVAKEAINVSAKVQDKVVRVNFHDGQTVNAGDLLVELEKTAQVAELRQAEINLNEELRELERYKRLNESKTIASKEYDLRVTAYERAKMWLDIAQTRVDERLIRAPFSGVLGNRRISLGDLVSTGTIITTLDDITELKVDFTVPEKYLAQLRRGLPFTVTSIAYPNREFSGEITNVGVRVNETTRNVGVRGIIKNSENAAGWILRPGMLLIVTLKLGETMALMLPEKAILSVGEVQYIFLYNPEGTVTRREVTLGLRRAGLAEVLSGLTAGEQFVSEGVSKLTDGMKVNVVDNL